MASLLFTVGQLGAGLLSQSLVREVALLIRPRPFLTCLIICLAPLLLLASINFWFTVNLVESERKKSLLEDLAVFISSANRILDEEGGSLNSLGTSDALHRYLAEETKLNSIALAKDSGNGARDLPVELKASLVAVFNNHRHVERLICFGSRKQPLIVVEINKANQGIDALKIQTKDFHPGLPQPDDRVWSVRDTAVLTSPLTAASFGASQAYTVPIFAEQENAATPSAALVGQINIDSVLAEAARPIEAKNSSSDFNSMVIVIDRSGALLYHPNDTLKHQPVAAALPAFKTVATSMMSNETGTSRFSLPTGQDYQVAFTPFPKIAASAAVASNPGVALSSARRAGWIGILLAGVIAFLTAVALSRYWQKQNRGIDTVTEGVTAIAKGKLDHRINVRSGDDARVIADNINLMTERLREQLAREAEARQFESFVRLSAMLTHDLKNSIEALSLIVGNMEVHFHNEEFRADMMKSLTLATEKLKALVARITNPVTTLSGEHRKPMPTDLTALVRRVVGMIAEPVPSTYQIELRLSQPVYALVDAERMEKVVENLLINALEAMADTGGKLTIEAGAAVPGKVYLNVSDTGSGMSAEFIEQRLFRPFATTKKNGVGLGLYTCREVVRANAGTIEVQSNEGVGTTFRVVLPSAIIERRN
ncbi:MAG TPA: ATP-binding protein [Pyrinomonadaceae bacterium]|nr:ATP-binding protein [Pyrinomonadaceae bacterium]